MASKEQCRTLLKNGKRCQYQGKFKGFCGIHRKPIKVQRRYIKALISAGKTAGALMAMMKLIESVTTVIAKHHSWFWPMFFYMRPEPPEERKPEDRLRLLGQVTADMFTTADYGPQQVRSLADLVLQELEVLSHMQNSN